MKAKRCGMCGGGKSLSYLCPSCERYAESVAAEQRGDLDREERDGA